jgi:hypothetical protein
MKTLAKAPGHVPIVIMTAPARARVAPILISTMPPVQ